MLNSVSEAGCDRMVHDSLGLRGWFSHSPIHRLSKHLLIPSMRVPRNCTERSQPCRMKLAEIRMTLSDHVCKAYMIHVPGRAGILSPVALRGVCPAFVLFNFLACYLTFVKSCY